MKTKYIKKLELKTGNVNKNQTLPKSVSSWKSKISGVLQKFGRGLMLPISVLPFAGILLGIGGVIGANTTSEAGVIFAGIFQGMSNIIFSNFGILFCIAVVITFTNEAGSAALMGIIGYLVFNSSQTLFIHYTVEGEFQDILYFHKDSTLASIVGDTLGIHSLSTSIFGGIIIGVVVAYIYNKFKYIKLPNAISFFSGVRFLPFIIIPASFLLAVGFLIFWPWIGSGINFIGKSIGKTPLGLDGFIYGIFTRSLMPFGLHQIVIAVAYQSPFGGVLSYSDLTNLHDSNMISNFEYQTLTNAWIKFQSINNITTAKDIVGDQSIWNYINQVPLNSIATKPIFDFFKDALNIHAGRFTQDYPTYLGVCMGIGIAFILTSDKSNRKATISVIGAAMSVAFLTGITEPLEFTFLFVSPLLYYAIYVPMSGFSYMFMELVGSHVGVGFARGFIDLIVYGALPVVKGTRFYYVFPLAIGQGGLTFIMFFFTIKKLDLATPGRKGNAVVLLSKKDYHIKKQNNNLLETDERLKNVLRAIGGLDNIVSITACATRLRTTVNDITLVDQALLKQLGASGVIIKTNNLQIIFGGEAVVFAEKINAVLN